MTHEIATCEVCGSETLQPVLDLGSHPLCDDLVPVGDPRICREYPIEILYCAPCATAHQRFQVPKRELFPKSYHYRSRFTADVLQGMSALVNACEQRLGGLKDKLVLDVGCNDGSLLDFFQARGASTLGIEPTGAYADAEGRGHEIHNAFFSVESAQEIRRRRGAPDIITFTNVFAHIEDLPAVLDALRALMSPATMLVIENHYLGAVIDRHQFDTFYHEHPRTYSLTSFVRIAASLEARLTGVQFPSRYGGNIRVFVNGPAAAEDGAALDEVRRQEARFGDELARMQGDVQRWQATMKARLADLVARHGKLPAKAFPGRAAILVKLLGLDESAISAVYEKPGSMKIGHYVPGTRIPIRSDEDFSSTRDSSPVLLNLAWHISDEIRGYLRKSGYDGEIVDILDPRDFAGGG